MSDPQEKLIQAIWETFAKANKSVIEQAYRDIVMGYEPNIRITWNEKLQEVIMERLEPNIKCDNCNTANPLLD